MSPIGPFERVLLIRCDNVGDVVMLSPAVRALRQAFPHARLTLLASPAGASVAGMLPGLDDVITERVLWQDVSGALQFDPAREQARIANLVAGRFDAAFIFTSFSQSPHAAAYACYLAGIPVRVGHSKEFAGGVLSHAYAAPPDAMHQAERNLRLLECFGVPVGDRRLELVLPAAATTEADELLAAEGIGRLDPFIALVPGASCQARRYPAERFAAVSRALAANGAPPVVALGNERERRALASVLGEETKSLLGRTDVPQFAAILRRASLILANNSSALHIGDAFARPLVLLYSGTELLSQWAPRYSPARILQRPTDCSPCYSFDCPFNLECLAVPPEEVAETALRLLEETRLAA